MGSDSSSVPLIPLVDREITRHDFPTDFVFGCATSAYQVEGAYAKGGRAYSIWDVYTNGYPGNVHDGSNANMAVDMYNRYKDDIKLMKNMGFDAYRFSISWSRILPGGKLSLGVNQEGVDYYNDLINTIIDNGMKPYVTLFHWDLPYLLEKEYGGFLSDKIIEDFRDYAELCFWEFGDRVKHWITINEAWTYCAHGYASRHFPPGHGYFGPENQPKPANLTPPPAHEQQQAEIFDMLDQQKAENVERILDETLNTDEGQNFIPYRGARVEKQTTFVRNNKTVVLKKLMAPPKTQDTEKAKEAYIVARNILLSHAHAVKAYRERFQRLQKGKIGMTNNINWFVPFHDTHRDRRAARRAFDFMLGWFMEPVLTGQYPQNMIDFVPRDRLELFTPEESELLRGSVDFLGINYYTTWYAKHDPHPDANEGYNKDMKVKFKFTGSSWLYIVPWGFNKLLKFINDTFNTTNNLPPIYITENGCDQQNDPMQSPHQACKDHQRVGYFKDHLAFLLKTIKEENMKIESYFAWSFCDNFEWYDGYRSRFGIYYIDFKNDLKRHAKDSAMWFARFLLQKPDENTEKNK
ncbi:hypothetical protein CASFOL_000166 [Castilleja foliolosa]|uniref:Beta-glucosidase n=1 Tax=Castilleja foliolosa TaxID=1961234 RepID=A0ABD3EMX2_9LAMI